jgi:tripartite-type tricarboxylate transporter receptor subunit TctC
MMTHFCRCFLLLAGLLAGSTALAQTYPARPLRMIVPFPPGGQVDIHGRLVAKLMEDRLGTQVVVENRAGAGGLVGTTALAQAPADGYTIGCIVPSAASRAFHKNPGLDIFTAFTSIGPLHSGWALLTTNPQTARTLKEFVDKARANPGSINLGVSSGPPAMIGALFASLAGIRMERIEYKGAAPAMTALVTNEVQANFGGVPQALPFMEAGKVIALAVGGDTRAPAVPNVPTMAELGYPDVKGNSLEGIFGPAGLPQPVMSRLVPVMKDIVNSPEIAKLFFTSGKVLNISNEEFMRMIREEVDFWIKAGQVAGYVPG